MRKKITVEGMSCKHCIAHVREALEELGGSEVTVSLDTKTAAADFSESVTDDSIKAAIEDAGYDVTEIITAE